MDCSTSGLPVYHQLPFTKLMSIESDFNVSILGVTQLNPRKLLFMSQYSSGPCHDPNTQLGTGNTRHIQSVPYKDGGVTHCKLFSFLTFVSCWSYGAFQHRGENMHFPDLRGATVDFSWDPRSWFLLYCVTLWIH